MTRRRSAGSAARRTKPDCSRRSIIRVAAPVVRPVSSAIWPAVARAERRELLEGLGVGHGQAQAIGDGLAEEDPLAGQLAGRQQDCIEQLGSGSDCVGLTFD